VHVLDSDEVARLNTYRVAFGAIAIEDLFETVFVFHEDSFALPKVRPILSGVRGQGL
jgi:hypothetical protein